MYVPLLFHYYSTSYLNGIHLADRIGQMWMSQRPQSSSVITIMKRITDDDPWNGVETSVWTSTSSSFPIQLPRVVSDEVYV